MALATLSWSESEPTISVDSGQQLRECLAQIAARNTELPITAMLEFPDGALLFIGLGRSETSLLVHEPIADSEWTAEWISVGNPNREGELDFYLFGHHTPHEARSAVPIVTAIDCAIEYLETRNRSSLVEWEENRF